MKDKATEMISVRTTLERKMRLIQNAAEKGIPLGTLCEEILCNSEAPKGKENSEVQNNQLKELLKTLEELLESNSQLQEQIKTLTEQQLKPVKRIKAKTEEETQNNVATENLLLSENKVDLIEQISLFLPLKEREIFVERVKKMFKNRSKSGEDKSVEETVYKCMKYCMNPNTFFETGRLED